MRTPFRGTRGGVPVRSAHAVLHTPAHHATAYGSRMVGGRPHRVLFFWHYMGNRCVTTLSNIFTNLNLSDMEVGYKVFKAEVIKGIQIKSGRFGVEPELTAKIAKGGWRIYEVPIQYHGRDYAHGKKITWRDGIAAIWHIIRFRYWD